jgi:hypothetical protein
VAVPVGVVAEAEAVADGVTDTVGLGTADGVLLTGEVLGVGVAGALLRAGELLRDGAGELVWLPCAGPSRLGGWTR